MSLLDFQHLHQQIKNKLFEISYKVECFNKTGDTDISRYAESYFKHLLNIIYKKDGWNFEKAVKINQDTYDLYDRNNKVCIQITSNNRQSKKKTTLKLFEEKYFEKEFEVLIILFISNSKPKSTGSNPKFNYFDFNIIEFCTLIEDKCSNSELLMVRDILLADLDLQRTVPAKSINKKNQSIKTTEKEFLRCKKLEKELKQELVIAEYWKHYEREQLNECPAYQFKSSRFILRSIEDDSYPNVDENSNWVRTFMYDFYERGILIWLDALLNTQVIMNEQGQWFIEDYFQRNNSIPEGSKKLSVRILGKLPYKNIVYYQDGDEYYNDHHLFCKYVGVENSAYEEIVYRYKNGLGYYWDDLDVTKKIERL